MTTETPELVEHNGDLRDGHPSCSCGWEEEAKLSPAGALDAYRNHLHIPWDGDEGWQTAMSNDHTFFIAAHERAYGALLGELKTQPSKGRIRKALHDMQQNGELTTQQPPYSEAVPVAPSSESEPTKEEGTE